MILRALSLDISASSTGWAFTIGLARSFQYGLIKTNPKFCTPERLAFFREELSSLLKELRPTHVVIEDVYSGTNKKVSMMLSEFVGVAKELCFSLGGIDSYIMHTNTVKSYFKSKKKEDVFEAIVSVFELNPDEVDFKKHNDIMDAVAQLICYYETVLGHRKFRFEKEYGYLYEV